MPEVRVIVRPDGCIVRAVSAKELPYVRGQLQRVGWIEPDRWWLRCCFRLLRRLFGDRGRIAEWTRRWPCSWRVDLRIWGGPLLQNIWNRQEAVEQEHQWVVANLAKIYRISSGQLNSPIVK